MNLHDVHFSLLTYVVGFLVSFQLHEMALQILEISLYSWTGA